MQSASTPWVGVGSLAVEAQPGRKEYSGPGLQQIPGVESSREFHPRPACRAARLHEWRRDAAGCVLSRIGGLGFNELGLPHRLQQHYLAGQLRWHGGACTWGLVLAAARPFQDQGLWAWRASATNIAANDAGKLMHGLGQAKRKPPRELAEDLRLERKYLTRENPLHFPKAPFQIREDCPESLPRELVRMVHIFGMCTIRLGSTSCVPPRNRISPLTRPFP